MEIFRLFRCDRAPEISAILFIWSIIASARNVTNYNGFIAAMGNRPREEG